MGGSDAGQALALALQPDGKRARGVQRLPTRWSGTFAGDVYRIYDLSATPTATVTITAGNDRVRTRMAAAARRRSS